MTRIATAMVLAAGHGKRMRPLTDNMPKPLVPLGGKPLIDHVLDRLQAAGITRAVVNVHHLADMLEAHLAKRTSPEIVISDERAQLLETGGGVVHALPLIEDEAFLIHNSDSVWLEGPGSNLQNLLSAWDPDAMDCLMLLASSARSLGYEGAGDFVMQADGRLARRAEGEVAPFVFAGVSIAHRRLFDGAESGCYSLNRLRDRALASDRLRGVRLDGFWMHVGTPDAIADAERCLINGDPSA